MTKEEQKQKFLDLINRSEENTTDDTIKQIENILKDWGNRAPGILNFMDWRGKDVMIDGKSVEEHINLIIKEDSGPLLSEFKYELGMKNRCWFNITHYDVEEEDNFTLLPVDVSFYPFCVNPIHIVALCGNTRILKLFLDMGVDIKNKARVWKNQTEIPNASIDNKKYYTTLTIFEFLYYFINKRYNNSKPETDNLTYQEEMYMKRKEYIEESKKVIELWFKGINCTNDIQRIMENGEFTFILKNFVYIDMFNRFREVFSKVVEKTKELGITSIDSKFYNDIQKILDICKEESNYEACKLISESFWLKMDNITILRNLIYKLDFEYTGVRSSSEFLKKESNNWLCKLHSHIKELIKQIVIDHPEYKGHISIENLMDKGSHIMHLNKIKQLLEECSTSPTSENQTTDSSTSNRTTGILTSASSEVVAGSKMNKNL